MSKRSRRRKRKRAPRRHHILSTGGMRRAQHLLERWDGFDYEDGIFRGTGRPAPAREEVESRQPDPAPRGCAGWILGALVWLLDSGEGHHDDRSA